MNDGYICFSCPLADELFLLEKMTVKMLGLVKRSLSQGGFHEKISDGYGFFPMVSVECCHC